MIKLECGDIIKMKKKHPCGSDEWEVIKVGADIKLKCCGCMHEIILKRSLVEKNTKKKISIFNLPIKYTIYYVLHKINNIEINSYYKYNLTEKQHDQSWCLFLFALKWVFSIF